MSDDLWPKEPPPFWRKVLRWAAFGLGLCLWGSGVAAMYGDDYKLAVGLYFAGIVLITADFLTLEDNRGLHGVKKAIVLGSTAIVATFCFALSVAWIQLRISDLHKDAKTPWPLTIWSVLPLSKNTFVPTIENWAAKQQEISSLPPAPILPKPKVKTQTAEDLDLLSGISDDRAGDECLQMTNTLREKWAVFWDKDDDFYNMLNGNPEPLTKKQRNTIAKQRERLVDKTLLDNQALLSQAKIMRDECFKRGLTKEGNDLKSAISKFYDLRQTTHHH